MARFNDFPIRKKLLLIIMTINLFTLILAFGGFAVYDVMMFREEARRHLLVLSDMIGYNCAAAIAFEDPADATETLAAFKANPFIESAWVYTGTGRPLAGYARDEVQAEPPSQLRPNGCYFENGSLFCFQPIVIAGTSVGTIFLRSDLSQIRSILNKHAAIIVCVMLISFACAFLLSARLQHHITGPLVRLARLARSVSKDKDYSVRGTREGKDEIGDLVDAFNEMLNEVQNQNASITQARQFAEASSEKAHLLADDMKQVNLELKREVSCRQEMERALKKYQKELEQMVQVRTAQLTLANEQLSREIAERKEAELKTRASLKEKTILLGEIHHRVRNNLQIISSLLNLSKGRTLNQEARQAIEEARSRIFTMALIHSQLHLTQDFSQIDMRGHIYKLWSSIHQIYEPLKRDVIPFINCRDVKLTLTQAIPCALVLNEAITNVFKHAYDDGKAGVCHISLERSQNDRIVMRIRDEGRGMPETVDVEKTYSLGIKLMRNLVRQQLGGKFHVDRSGGTDIRIEFDLLQEDPIIHAKYADKDF
ncbi:MAG: histidine kinase dimerization/phosphoacceptor domain -containing protein [Candidatus Desulfacyla sp.]